MISKVPLSSFTFNRINVLLSKDILFGARVDVIIIVGDDDINHMDHNVRHSKFFYQVENYLIANGYSILRIRNDLHRPIFREPNYSHGLGFIYFLCHMIDAFISKVRSCDIATMRTLYWHLLSRKWRNAKAVIGIGLKPWHNLSFKRYGVPTIEVLHGLGYSWVPWNWDKLDRLLLPDHLIAFDRISQKTFQNLTKINNKNVYLSGYPIIKGSPIKREKRPYVVLTLQHNYGGERDDWAGLFDEETIDSEIENLIAQTPEIIWRVKLHPVQVARPEYENARKRVDEIAARYKNVDAGVQDNSVFDICRGAVCHITRSSMSAYEAAFAGVKTLAVCPTLLNGGVQEHKFVDLEEEGLLERIPASEIDSEMIFKSKMVSDFSIKVDYADIIDVLEKNIIK